MLSMLLANWSGPKTLPLNSFGANRQLFPPVEWQSPGCRVSVKKVWLLSVTAPLRIAGEQTLGCSKFNTMWALLKNRSDFISYEKNISQVKIFCISCYVFTVLCLLAIRATVGLNTSVSHGLKSFQKSDAQTIPLTTWYRYNLAYVYDLY